MNIESISKSSLHKAAQLLRLGKLVAFPTETVYGLGADATNNRAVAEIFAVKSRPQFNPLIVHVESVAMAQGQVTWNSMAEKLAHAFWPGPLTLVLPRKHDSVVSLLASAGGDTLGLRMPANQDARALIQAAGVPLAAPSANRSGRVSPTRAHHVKEELGKDIPLILDGGACEVGIESTVVDISGKVPILLRPGSVTREQIEAILGQKLMTQGEQTGALKSPGLLLSHYAPSLPVRLNVTAPRLNEALLAFGPHVPGGAKTIINLSEAGDLKEAAAHLFAGLRTLDIPGFTAIAVMPIPEEGLGIAINDRLTRAAKR
jgi:L-threonylcarbamoyladenylate synthase